MDTLKISLLDHQQGSLCCNCPVWLSSKGFLPVVSMVNFLHCKQIQEHNSHYLPPHTNVLFFSDIRFIMALQCLLLSILADLLFLGVLNSKDQLTRLVFTCHHFGFSGQCGDSNIMYVLNGSYLSLCLSVQVKVQSWASSLINLHLHILSLLLTRYSKHFLFKIYVLENTVETVVKGRGGRKQTFLLAFFG